MSDSFECVDNQDGFECVNGIFILKSSDEEDKKMEKTGKFSNY